MSRQLKIKKFNPNSVGNLNHGMFGLPFSIEESHIVVLPIPWDVTVSYAAGASKGPKAIYNASYQVDLYDPYLKDAWKIGVAMAPINTQLKKQSKQLRSKVETYIETLTNGADEQSTDNVAFQASINEACQNMINWVEQETTNYLNAGKLVVGLGGDHSTPLGIFKAMAKKHGNFGILQIDAHADLRNAYEGFEFSHASIMYNALKIKELKNLVQVGIRDYCEEENSFIENNKDRIKTFFDKDIKHAQYGGKSIKKIHEDIVKALPNKVFVSFDIDGLDPKLCPSTGTPVSGGFETEEVLHLLEMVVAAGKTIIGFDLNEVAPGNNEYDANVAARILYRMINILAKSNKLKI